MDFVHERRKSPAHNVEIHPARPCGFQLRADAPPLDVITSPRRLAGLRRKTQASSPGLSEMSFHARMSSISPADSAAFLIDRVLFGESICPRYTLWRICACVSDRCPHLSPKISLGRSPTRIASLAISRSLGSRTVKHFGASSQFMKECSGRLASLGTKSRSAGLRTRYPSATAMRKPFRRAGSGSHPGQNC